MIATTALLLVAVLVAFLLVEIRELRRLGAEEAAARATAVEAAKQELATALARSTALASQAALFERNFPYLQALVETAATSDRDLRFVVVADERGRVVADSRPSRPEQALGDDLGRQLEGQPPAKVVARTLGGADRLWIYAARIEVPGQQRTLGQLRVGISMLEKERQLEESLEASRARVSGAVHATGIIAGVLLLLGVALGVAQGVSISRPIRRLSEQAQRIAGGDLSIRVAVSGADEIANLSADFNHMADQLARLLAEAGERAAVEKELEVARVVQESLVPSAEPVRHGPLTLAGRYEPASICGGDFWTWKLLDAGRILVLIGDVVGHGIPAALITAVAIGCCENLPPSVTPSEVLSMLHRTILEAGKGRFCMTAFACIIDARGALIEYSNAGQPFPYVARRSQATLGRWALEPLAMRGPLLGEDRKPEFETLTRRWHTGDVLIWYTDGATEASCETGEMWGDKRLRSSFMRALEHKPLSVAQLRDSVLADLDQFRGAAPPRDDITLVVGTLGTA